ncbi:LuxR C-terminal-related transcriptional regulator [soil metagenome]
MPKAAQHELIWSPAQQIYRLQSLGASERSVQFDDIWFTWLTTQRSFAFRGQQGQINLLRERRKGSDRGYWYAYRRQGTRILKRYVGRDADLSMMQLETVAHALNQSRGDNPSTTAQHDTSSSLLGNKILPEHAPDAAPQPTSVHESAPSARPPYPLPLLIPKLHLPRLHTDLVMRPRLLRQLDSALTRRLTLVIAPAGFGKTTLVRQWIAESSQNPTAPAVAWLALDAEDNDPVRFWRYVIEAFEGIAATLGEAARGQLSSLVQLPFAPLPLEIVLTTLLNALIAHTQPCLLVVEDYHLITAESIHTTVAFFLEHLPHTVHLLILTRHEPPLPLARLRARNELLEITAGDLRFSPTETQAFLAQAITLARLSPAEQHTVRHALLHLDTQLEGWAVGLRLLALTLEGQQTAAAIEHSLATFVGSHRPILDYFVGEVLNTLAASQQHFLLQISVLGRLTASLCDAVTGQANSETLLVALAQAGLFLEPLGGHAAWYRFHTLFAEAMQHEARRRLGNERLSALAYKASLWYEQQDLLAEAVEAALRTPNFARAAQLIKQLGDDQRFYGKFQHTGLPNEFYTLQRWLEQLPPLLLHQHPELCLDYATALLMIHFSERYPEQVTARIDEALNAAETGFRAVGNRAKLAEIFAFRALLTLQYGEIHHALTCAQQALAWLRPDELAWRSVSHGVVGLGELLTGRLETARQQLQTALSLIQVIGNPHFLRATLGQLSAVSFEAGDLHQAAAYLRPVLAEARIVGDHDDIGHAQLGLAQIAYEWNNLAEAQAAATEALDAIQRTDNEALFASAELLLMRVQAAQGQRAMAQQQLARVLASMQPQRSPRHYYFYRELRAEGAQFDLDDGDLAAVQRWWTMCNQEEQPLPPLYAEREAALVGRWLLAQGKPTEALAWLGRVLVQAQQAQRTRNTLEIQVVMALAHAAAKDLTEAKATLQATLEFTAPQGYLRLFLDEGHPLATLLRTVLPGLHTNPLRAYGQTILRAFAREPNAPAETLNSLFLIEPLTPQEGRVLRQLATGHTNAAMARDLVVSVNTIRTQVQSIYHKLGVNNRVTALETARQLGLL